MDLTGLSCNLCRGLRFVDIVTEDGFDVVACSDCGLIFVANPPSDEGRARLYSFEAGYHQALVDHDRTTALHTKEAEANLALLRRHVRAGRLLDMGCSTGLFLKAARESGWLGQGLEYSPDSSRIAVEKYGLQVHCGELRQGLYAARAFDVITLWDVIEHVPDPHSAIKMLRDCLAPGGWLVLKTPNADGLYPRLGRLLAKRLGFWGHVEPPGHLYQFTVATLGRMVRGAGLDVVAVHHQRIPIGYSFGSFKDWFRSAKWAVYCLAFIPLAVIGPWLQRGDDMVLVARKRASSAGSV